MPVLPPPLLALAAGVGQRVLTGPTARPGPVRVVTSAALVAVSAALASSASHRFRVSGTTVEPFRPEQASALVTDGANGITRNPMYVGMAGMLVAHAVWRGSPVALLPAAAFVAFIDRVQISAEERALAQKFGDAYEDYLASVPRWIDARSVGR
ncbi:hypothetical protein GCM10009623_24640 [Nocardioides aestuarii]|uniref:Methyltransferase family protein n=1 Tax=Nocardioides aestuarii TaxID=252231 RepID=A0ABW4TPQ0_9ACTN